MIVNYGSVYEFLVILLPLSDDVLHILAKVGESGVNLPISSVFELDVLHLVAVQLDVGLDCELPRLLVFKHDLAVLQESGVDLRGA